MAVAQLGLLLGAQAFATGASLTAGQTLGLTTIASYAGFLADAKLFGENERTRQVREKNRIGDTDIQGSNASEVIPRLVGRDRLAGNIIWATQYREEIYISTESDKTRTGKKSSQTIVTDTVEYLYSISVAIGLCEGPILGIQNVWVDGDLWTPEDNTYEVYKGTEDQDPSPIIQRIQGSENTPAYRGTAYFVIEDVKLKNWGNRIPQMLFEVLMSPYEHITVELPEVSVDSLIMNTNGGNFSLADEPLYYIGSAIGVDDLPDDHPDKNRQEEKLYG